ncbi:MAG: carbamoyl-phosphate synthase large subunit [Armatimonadetes bacterium]|nr:carbamoyl-phosphate synthase large subunit [Armatimonadota bacterium]
MQKILVIGSGPIIIGQAAEFDYAGTQACKSLREEGYKVVLINSNPATIMTDEETADAVYIEPLTPEFCERVIARERPDGLLPTLGGQTGLNLASQLAQLGILEKYNVKLLGTQLEAIRKAEDREEFRALMREIKEPVPESWIVESDEDLQAILDVVPYPCIVRPAYTLGGTGGGIANTREDLWEIGRKGLKLSMRSQLMVERSLLGWKEVEYEVMRDGAGNCITVCNMENLDPMGVHTGDSIVVAPSQTLSDIEYHMLRTASLKIIGALGIQGGCNVQLAVNPESFDYYVIEVNPRVSRSSALASKATGYPIARVAAKIAIGKTLDEIDNAVTKTTKACFEPALDYCVVKIPRWPFDKFASGDRRLSTQMKATGEVMAIDRTFETALMKAVRGLEVKSKDLRHPKMVRMSTEELEQAIRYPTDERLWALAEGLRRGWGVARVHDISNVDEWFLNKMMNLLAAEKSLVSLRPQGQKLEADAARTVVNEAFLIGYPSDSIRSLVGLTPNLQKTAQNLILASTQQPHGDLEELALQHFSQELRAVGADEPESSEEALADADWVVLIASIIDEIKHMPVFKMVDTCAGEFESMTPYYYTTFEQEDDFLGAGIGTPR